MMDITTLIRDVPDFPKPGILFKDITPLLQSPSGFHTVIDVFAKRYAQHTPAIDVIVGIESRGFIFSAALAYHMELPLVLIRKKGKLPFLKVSHSYQLEYGEDRIEMHEDAIFPGAQVLLVDDLLATGGTALAACHLIEKVGGVVAEVATVIELDFLEGRKKLASYSVYSQVNY